MASYVAEYFGAGRSTSRLIEEHNARLFAAQQRLRRGPTIEVYFPRRIDNSRLVKAPDMVRLHEMRLFTAACVVFFTLVMVYGWQHFSSIELGYRVEAKRQQLEQLREENHQLRLTQAELAQPERIDALARQMGMDVVRPDQVVRVGDSISDAVPVMAQSAAPPLIASGGR
jgi:Cell division protein FtsL.